MSFTGRIRLFLILVALAPPLLTVAVAYVYTDRRAQQESRLRAAENLADAVNLRDRFKRDLAFDLDRISRSPEISGQARSIRRGFPAELAGMAANFDLDFLELVDSAGVVRASSHRPGLVGENLWSVTSPYQADTTLVFERLEYDRSGPHPSMAGMSNAPGRLTVYGGRYLEQRLYSYLSIVAGGQIRTFQEEELEGDSKYVRMNHGQLYSADDGTEAVLVGGAEVGFLTVAFFEPVDSGEAFATFLNVIIAVSGFSFLVALTLGIYISSRARREFDNLIGAFRRVAEGDLNTAVMAYDESEFSQLADSFSEMTRKLKQSQSRLAASEKIAAWQIMARKIAHEVKNPLTPIAIGADDIRHSYNEKHPNLDRTIANNTEMITAEVNRLSRLLDEFSAFARMAPPIMGTVSPEQLLEEVKQLYAHEQKAGRIKFESSGTIGKFKADREQLKQLLVNLIKNGFESAEDATVKVTSSGDEDSVSLTVEDTGPGFNEQIIKDGFQPYLSTKQNGTGLGLVICERIAHDHGGTIDLCNLDSKGAGVAVTLPRN